MFNLYSSMNRRNGDEPEKPKELETTGHDRFCQTRSSRNPYRKKRKRVVQRAQSAAEFDPRVLSAANKRNLFKVRSASSEQEHSDSEHSEKSPLVSAKLETFAKLLFNRSLTQDSATSKDNTSPTRHSLKYQYSALDSGNGTTDRSPRERAARDRALGACQEWMKTLSGRYEIIAHLDDIGSRNNKNWFLLSDSTIRTDRLMTLLPIPPDCVALEELPPSECPKGILMELLGSLQHPYIYPVLDLGFLSSNATHYACLVMPFNLRGSLKDLIYKAQWNESYNRKYTRKSACLPLSQVQRLGRQILEALLFLRERGFPSHGHLHSGNVILQNGVARLSGIENGLLGLNSRVNAVMWSRNVNDIENMDIICFGHLLFEMCAGYELNAPQPTAGHLELDLERYPQVVEVLQMIFESPDGRYPSVEELVMCDLFRNIDLREMRGPGISSFKHGLSNSTLNLLNAVRRRQGASLGGSYSEGSSPCTPPSTPRDRRTGSRELDSFDVSSDSDGGLEEIVITPSSFDFPHYDLQNSPIHICDNSITQSDDRHHHTVNQYRSHVPHHTNVPHPNYQHHDHAITSTCSEDYEMTTASTINSTCNQLTTESCCTSHKNSTSRRMEYSLRGMKVTGSSSNPSQDSAFGSMTDGEPSIASSSQRLSSFQSISSPIDEGVEDISSSMLDLTSLGKNTNFSDMSVVGAADTIARSTSANVSLEKSVGSDVSATVTLEPPKILVNDQSSFYTTSPSKTCGGTIEVFSQKYRVSSFEDMSLRKTSLKNVNKMAFRSLEEERRIDSAFQPVTTIENCRSASSSRMVPAHNNEKFKKLTHAAFSRKISTTKERHTKWKNSILVRKNHLIKSNESLIDHASTDATVAGASSKMFSHRVGSTNSLFAGNRYDSTESIGNRQLIDEFRRNPRKSHSERYLVSLCKLKQSAINDYQEDHDDDDETDDRQYDGFCLNRSEIVSFIDETSSSEAGSSSCDEDTSSSPSHRDVCQIIGGLVGTSENSSGSAEDNTPLLIGMEMSPISPSETDTLL